MGYYTRYNLKWQPTDSAKIEFPRCKHKVEKSVKFCPECGAQNLPLSLDDMIAQYIRDNSNEIYGVDEEGESSDACKWYDHEKDMRAMSKFFTGVIFTLHGEGEESGDIWNEYYLNGKCQIEKARIVVDCFDKSKLK